MKLFDENPDVEALCFAVDFVGHSNTDWNLSVNVLGHEGASLRPSQKMLINALTVYWSDATGPMLDRWFEKHGFLGAFEVIYSSDGQMLVQPRANMIVDPTVHNCGESISDKKLLKMQRRINKHATAFIDDVVAHIDGEVACHPAPLVVLHTESTSQSIGSNDVVLEVQRGI